MDLYKKNIVKYLLLIVLGFLFYIISYGLTRDQFFELVSLYSACGFLYLVFIKYKFFSVKELIFFSIGLRVILLFHEPNLSDDYYRFIWDGHLTNQGINPFNDVPSTLIAKEEFKNNEFYSFLYEKLNSPNYYTIYPPVNQFIFATASYFGEGSVPLTTFYLKLCLLFFEIGVILLIFKLLKTLILSHHLAIIYLFNPLTVIEIMGNLHFEGVMVFFLAVSLFFLLKNKIFWSAILFAFAIDSKLLPIVLLPFLIHFIGWRNSFIFGTITLALALLLFFPYMNNTMFEHMGKSVNLYFQSFEFNASVHYILRYLGMEFTGFNWIQQTGYLLSGLLVVFIFYRALLKKSTSVSNSDRMMEFMKNSADTFFLFYILASIVHPWYLLNILLFVVFVNKPYIIAWTLLIPFTYFAYSHYIEVYHDGDKHLSNGYFFIVFVEYFIVFMLWFFSKRLKRLLSYVQH